MAPAASVGPSVPSVPALKTTTLLEAGDLDGRGQHELLIAPAESVAAHGDRGLAAGDDAGRRRERAPGDARSRGRWRRACARSRASRLRSVLERTSGAVAELARAAPRRLRAPGGCCRRSSSAYASKTGSPGLGVSADFAARAALDALADAGRHALANPVLFEHGARRRTWRRRERWGRSRSRRDRRR